MQNRRLNTVLTSALLAVLASSAARAAPIQLVPGTVNMFRDTRAASNVGLTPGDRLQYGADVVGGSDGTSLGASYAPSAFVQSQVQCSPLAVSPNFCSNANTFNASRLAQPWTLRFERTGETPLTVSGPSLAGTEQAVPFPVNVTITGAGLTPTISWTVPQNQTFTADAVRVNIFDRNQPRSNGVADIIHSFAVAGNLGSYAIPTNLSSGQKLALGGDYSFNVQLIDTRGDPTRFVASNNNAEILRRSSSFFNFTPLSNNGPPTAFLPTVVNGVYNFAIENVGPNSVTFIDPLVAIGYDYAIGAGNPNFASVVPPTGIGNNLFDLFLWNGTEFVDSNIDLVGKRGGQVFNI